MQKTNVYTTSSTYQRIKIINKKAREGHNIWGCVQISVFSAFVPGNTFLLFWIWGFCVCVCVYCKWGLFLAAEAAAVVGWMVGWL